MRGSSHDSRHRRAARRQAESRDVGSDCRRAADWRRREPISRSPCSCRARASTRLAAELAAAAVQEVVTVEHAGARALHARRLHGGAAGRLIAQLSPSTVVLPHTYQTRDFAPKLAARLDRAIITDVTGGQAVGGAGGVRAADVPGQADGGRRAPRGRRPTS